jgi:hypothetical protein
MLFIVIPLAPINALVTAFPALCLGTAVSPNGLMTTTLLDTTALKRVLLTVLIPSPADMPFLMVGELLFVVVSVLVNVTSTLVGELLTVVVSLLLTVTSPSAVRAPLMPFVPMALELAPLPTVMFADGLGFFPRPMPTLLTGSPTAN